MSNETIDTQFVSEFEEVYHQLGYYPRAVIINMNTAKAEYKRMSIEYNFSE